MPRIVSLIPSATEIVAALGHGDDLVGRSHECDHPPGVEALPALTAPKVPLEGSSREIDDRVRALLDEAMSVYDVDVERLNALRPDVILTQSQCEVCAVSLPTVEQAVADRIEGTPTVVALEPRSLADVHDDIRRVAAALGCPDRGDRCVRQMRDRVRAISNAVAPPDATDRPTVAALEWIDPLSGGRGLGPDAPGSGGRDAGLCPPSRRPRRPARRRPGPHRRDGVWVRPVTDGRGDGRSPDRPAVDCPAGRADPPRVRDRRESLLQPARAPPGNLPRHSGRDSPSRPLPRCI
jgi:ABC-type Fe3+-hydroxamate transport system, periplasmic component